MASGQPIAAGSDPAAVVGRFVDAWNDHDMPRTTTAMARRP